MNSFMKKPFANMDVLVCHSTADDPTVDWLVSRLLDYFDLERIHIVDGSRPSRTSHRIAPTVPSASYFRSEQTTARQFSDAEILQTAKSGGNRVIFAYAAAGGTPKASDNEIIVDAQDGFASLVDAIEHDAHFLRAYELAEAQAEFFTGGPGAGNEQSAASYDGFRAGPTTRHHGPQAH